MRPGRSIRPGLTRCKSDRLGEGEFMRYRLSAAIALVMVGLLVVVGLGSPASAATPTETYKGGKCGWVSIGFPGSAGGVTTGTDRYGCLSGEPVNGPAQASHSFYYCVDVTCNGDPARPYDRISKPLPVGAPLPPYDSTVWERYGSVKAVGASSAEFTVYRMTLSGTTMTNVSQGRLKMPAAGVVPVDPSVTCDGFRSTTYAAVLGTLDLSWRWSGTVPSRGWRITDAALGAAPGSGAQLFTVPVTPLAGTSRYGVADWPVPAGVASLRVESRNDPGCYLGFSVSRNASGAVTGIAPAGTLPDSTPEADPKDSQGNSCSMINLPCHLEYLFIPNPKSWGWSELRTSITTRPPLSMVSAIWSGMGQLSSAFSTSNCDGVNFGLQGSAQNWDSGEFRCEAGSAAHGGVLYEIVRYCLLAVTAVYLYRTLMAGFKS